MAITATTTTLAKTSALDIFDTYTYMGIGTGTTAELVSQTALVSETFRGILEGSTKTIAAGTYAFEGRIPLGEANGASLRELGLFNASTSGTMGWRKLLDSAVTKTSDDELYFTVTLSVSVA